MLKDSNSSNQLENCKSFDSISLLLFSIEEPVIEDYLTWGLKIWQDLPAKGPRTMSGVNKSHFLSLPQQGIEEDVESTHWGTLGHFDETELGDWVIFFKEQFNCIYAAHLLYPFHCQWTLKLLPCPGYCKQCCSEHRCTCIFYRYGFLQVCMPRSGIAGS